VRIDKAERRFLALETNKNTRKNGMLEDVGEVAGVKGVAVVDLGNPSLLRFPALEPSRGYRSPRRSKRYLL